MRHSSSTPRLLRGMSAALAATFAALLAHVAAGGAAPEVGALATPLGLSMLASVLLQARKLSVPRIIAAVVASQALFHFLFVIGAEGAHVHSASLIGDVTMWGTHVLAALATILYLVRGEHAIHRLREIADHLAEWLRIRLSGSIVISALPARAGVQLAAERSWLLLSQLHGYTQPHRGPPISN